MTTGILTSIVFSGRSAARVLARVGLILLAVALTGCSLGRGSSLSRPSPETIPAGSPLLNREMSDEDAWLRHHVLLGQYESALGLLNGRRSVSGDRLWRELQKALVLHHAGEYARSNEAFEWSEREADLRYTRSATRAASSLFVSDRALAFTPSAAELAMIPYYRMMNYLGLGDLQGAAVEARKANALLAREGRSGAARCGEDAMVGYVAGVVLQAAGDRNDALVSLRRAEQDFLDCDTRSGVRLPAAMGEDLVRAARALGVGEVADSAAERYGVEPSTGPGGELLLLLEHGFIAHRTEEALHIPIYPSDLEDVTGETDLMTAAATIAARVLNGVVQRSVWGAAWEDHPAVQISHALEGAYVLRLVWPGIRRDQPGRAIRVWVNDTLAVVTPVSDLSTLTAHELEAQRLAILTRMVARGLTKYVASRAAETEAEKKGGEVMGFLVGRLTNLVANDLERADTRSWSLLPDQVSMVRAHLPEGEHHVRLEVLDAHGETVQQRDLGVLRVAAGDLVLRNERIWGPIHLP